MKRHAMILVLLLAVAGTVLPAEAGGKVLSYEPGEKPRIHLRSPLRRPEAYRIKRVIDGDTVELTDGRLIRYLGVDTPELRRREGERWVYDPRPFSEAAMTLNQKLVEGKEVRLEFDRQRKDRFGRLLAYVFVKGDAATSKPYDGAVFLDGNEIFVNGYLLREGVAELFVIPPNGRYAKQLERLEEEARRAHRQLWSQKRIQGTGDAGQR